MNTKIRGIPWTTQVAEHRGELTAWVVPTDRVDTTLDRWPGIPTPFQLARHYNKPVTWCEQSVARAIGEILDEETWKGWSYVRLNDDARLYWTDPEAGEQEWQVVDSPHLLRVLDSVKSTAELLKVLEHVPGLYKQK